MAIPTVENLAFNVKIEEKKTTKQKQDSRTNKAWVICHLPSPSCQAGTLRDQADLIAPLNK